MNTCIDKLDSFKSTQGLLRVFSNISEVAQKFLEVGGIGAIVISIIRPRKCSKLKSSNVTQSYLIHGFPDEIMNAK